MLIADNYLYLKECYIALTIEVIQAYVFFSYLFHEKDVNRTATPSLNFGILN